MYNYDREQKQLMKQQIITHFKVLCLEEMASDLKKLDQNTSQLRSDLKQNGLQLRYSEFHPSLCTQNYHCMLWPLLLSI